MTGIATCLLIVALLGIGLYSYFLRTHMQLYISPIASACKDIKLCLGASSDEAQLNSLKKLLSDEQISYSAIGDTNGTFIVSLQKGSEAVLSNAKDLQLQISSLQYIISRLTMEGREFKKLDLRFDKPIIVLK